MADRPAAAALPPLRELRNGLLRLHKLLLERERGRYQREHGPVESQHAFLGLVLSHAQFQWLRVLSELIVNIDEALDEEDQGRSRAQALVEQARELLTYAEPRGDFQQHYALAREADPNILVESSTLYRLLRG
ncbi:MAG: hypothetical protein ACM3SS_11905 [Rhodospirillaceae bacterium]